MAIFRCTSKLSLGGSNGIPKGTTVQVITPNGVNSVDANKIQAAIKQQLGKDLQTSVCVASHFDVVRLK